MLNPNEISKLTPEDANTTPILPNVNRNKASDSDSKFAKKLRDIGTKAGRTAQDFNIMERCFSSMSS